MRLSGIHAAAVLCVIAAAAALGVALASERFGGLVPCALCLLERWPYRVAIVLGIAAALLPPRGSFAVLGLLGFVLLGGAVLGGIHVGVEQHLWPSPLPECAAPHLASGSIAARLASMPAHPSKPCDDPTYLVAFLPLSMATMNLVFALGAAVLLAIFLWYWKAASDE